MPLVRLGAFALFLLLGAGVALAARTRYARLAERAFVAYTTLMMLAAGLGNRDLWPFSSYPIIPESSARYREAVWYEVRAVDARGVEHAVDARAWAPLTPFVIDKWIERTFLTKLDEHGRKCAARFLRARAEALTPASAERPVRALRIYRNDWTSRALAYEIRE